MKDFPNAICCFIDDLLKKHKTRPLTPQKTDRWAGIGDPTGADFWPRRHDCAVH